MVLPCPSERPDNSRWWDELMRRSVLVFFVTLLLGISVAYAGESRPSAEASADRSEVLVGDFIQYFVSLKYPSGVRVEWPSVGGTLGDFVVVGAMAGIADHAVIGSGARIAGMSGVVGDLPGGRDYGGILAKPIRDWHKESATLSKLAKTHRHRKND